MRAGGVVDQDVEPPPGLDRRRGRGRGVGEAAHVGAHEARPAAAAAIAGLRGAPGRLVDLGDQHAGAGAGQRQRAGLRRCPCRRR